jgi:hypothetical protein
MAAIGRNDACPCGSGKKYKKCCLDKAAALVHAPNLSPTEREMLGALFNPPCTKCGAERDTISCEDFIEIVGEKKHAELEDLFGKHSHLFCHACKEPSSLSASEAFGME